MNNPTTTTTREAPPPSKAPPPMRPITAHALALYAATRSREALRWFVAERARDWGLR